MKILFLIAIVIYVVLVMIFARKPQKVKDKTKLGRRLKQWERDRNSIKRNR